VLVVTTRDMFPVNRGDSIHNYNLVKYLSNYFDITVLSLTQNDEQSQKVKTTKNRIGLFKTIKHSRALAFFGVISALVTNRPMQVGYYSNKLFKKMVEEHMKDAHIAIFHLVRSYNLVPKKCNIPIIMDMADALSLNYARSIDKGNINFALRWVYNTEMNRILDYEIRSIKRFDRVFLHTKSDKDYLLDRESSILEEKIELSTQGVNFDLFRTRPDSSKNSSFLRKRVVFVGTMSYLPNIKAVLFFANKVFPSILTRFPGAKFYVVGSNPPKQVSNLSKQPNICVTGRVDSVYDYYADSTVSVCPVNIGAGIQNKILESMSVGVPVVASTMSSSGLLDGYQDSILIANDVDEWVDCVIRMFTDFSLYEEKSRKAGEYVRKNYDWSCVLKPYKESVDLMTNKEWYE